VENRAGDHVTLVGPVHVCKTETHVRHLQQVLEQMAGPGATMRVNGFTGGRLPPKSQIRSIRFRQNSFDAEYHEGGGFGIAAGCDLRIATPDATFGIPIARTLGNCLSAANIGRLSALIGATRLKEIIFTARLIEAPEALSLGLLNEVVPDVPTLQRRADETAKLVAGHAPITMETAKEAVLRLRRTLSREEGRDLILRAYMSEDFREGMDAFLNKRTPNWKGK